VSFVTPEAGLFHRLLPVARRIFTETFGDRYEPVQFELYCDRVYGPAGSMAGDFAAPGVHWQVAVLDGEPIGYAKLTPLRAPAASALPGAVEVQQIYVLSAWHGTGVASKLMDWSLATARRQGAPEAYLTVFDHNERAKRFYARYGFEDVGQCTFRMGDRIDDDRIWRLRLTD
jgi:GNAT superfamily N-acetyltransferase